MAQEALLRVSTAEAKRRLSELINRAAFGHQRIIITKRGRPMATLAPYDESRPHLAEAKGWLASDDSFFAIIDEIVRDRARHRPRSLRARR